MHAEAKSWEHTRHGPNAWNEGPDTVFHYQAHRRAVKHLVTRLIEYPANPVQGSEE
jgi:hypothetical protein